ncbi:MAG TPA: hypothetical protein PKK33_08370, partial [Candidatus Cloacimonadota bacterium]|nr:hypothetical protein [Candidatus Cloacimonadota bacterium]
KADIYLVRDGQAWKGNQAIPASQINSIPYESFIIVNNGNLYMPDAIRQAIMGKVEGGSGLLFMGKPVAGLGMMLPASSSNIANTYQSNFKLNAAAGAYSFLDYDAKVIADIPPVQYYYVQAKEGSAVLGTMDNDQNSPAILFKQFGKGKVFEFAFLDLWKWQMWVDNSDYHTVIGNILLWMGNQDLLRFRAQTTKNSYFLGERVRIVLSAVDDKQMPVTDLDAQIQILNSHNRAVYSDYLLKDGDDYQVQLSSLEPDTYHFKVYDERTKQRTEGSFIVSNSNMENRDYGFNQPALFYVSQITNGKSLSQSDLSVYKPMKEQTKPDIRRMEIPLYRKWYLITLFLVCFCVELLFRRIWGLL